MEPLRSVSFLDVQVAKSPQFEAELEEFGGTMEKMGMGIQQGTKVLLEIQVQQTEMVLDRRQEKNGHPKPTECHDTVAKLCAHLPDQHKHLGVGNKGKNPRSG